MWRTVAILSVVFLFGECAEMLSNVSNESCEVRLERGSRWRLDVTAAFKSAVDGLFRKFGSFNASSLQYNCTLERSAKNYTFKKGLTLFVAFRKGEMVERARKEAERWILKRYLKIWPKTRYVGCKRTFNESNTFNDLYCLFDD